MSLSKIVELLKGPPFERKVTQVTLDEQTPQAWMQLISDIVTTLADEPRIDVRDETPDTTSFRLVDFLTRTLNYQQRLSPFAHNHPCAFNLYSFLFC
jgi:hypothetical protein